MAVSAKGCSSAVTRHWSPSKRQFQYYCQDPRLASWILDESLIGLKAQAVSGRQQKMPPLPTPRCPPCGYHLYWGVAMCGLFDGSYAWFILNISSLTSSFDMARHSNCIGNTRRPSQLKQSVRDLLPSLRDARPRRPRSVARGGGQP